MAMRFVLVSAGAVITNQGIKRAEADDRDQQADAAEYSQYESRYLIIDQAFIDKSKINQYQADAKPDTKIAPAYVALYRHIAILE